MTTADFIVIGGGIAGLSAAAALASHGRTTILEAEEAVGTHSSGRSATFAHYGIGDATVRGLTSYSRRFFLDPPEGFAEVPLARAAGAMFIAREETVPDLDALEADMRRFTDTVSRLSVAEMQAICPILRTGPGAVVAGLFDSGGLKLDADAFLQGYARQLRARGKLRTNAPITAIRRVCTDWEVEAGGERLTAPIIVNAAGAWADRVAALAGVRPLGLEPLRRTIIVVDPPAGIDVSAWPFIKTATSEFYMLPEAGRLMVSPVDEVPDQPRDAQPEEYDLALAAWRLEEYTTLNVSHIAHRWAGLRTFTADRVPTAGFAPDAPGFFWLAGQGGYGLQTAPAMAAIAASLVTGAKWPSELTALGVAPEQIRPERLFEPAPR